MAAGVRIGHYDARVTAAAVALAYAESLDRHIRYVQEACRILGVPDGHAGVHDESKYSLEEFGAYARHFHGGGDPAGFSFAWLHHIHHNPHHWQHWLFADGFSPKGSNIINGALPMPLWYVREMIADWMGASRAYTGEWDMASWLFENIPRIKLHPATAEMVRGELDGLGYADVIGRRFLGE